MKKVNKRKYYRPGSLEVPGTKVSLKTQPYVNGVLFNPEDPITSFRAELIEIKGIINTYEQMKSIPGMDACLRLQETTIKDYDPLSLGRAKLLLDLLIESPTEISIKEQIATDQIIADALNFNNERGEDGNNV